MRTMTKRNKIEWKNIRILPILHNRMEFALEVRRQFEEFKPDRVAVEYPATLGDLILKGIARLPLLSAVHYQEPDGTFVYLLLEPTDGHVEVLRLAGQNNLEIHFVDRMSMPSIMELTKGTIRALSSVLILRAFSCRWRPYPSITTSSGG